MLRGSTLVLALVFTAPEIWRALTGEPISIDTLVLRFLLAVPIAGALLSLARAARQPRTRDGSVPRRADRGTDGGPAR